MIGFSCLYNLIVYWCLKTFIIMANFEIRFFCESETGDFITAKEQSTEIVIEIRTEKKIKGYACLSKSTAIKFAKTLRTEINKIKDE